MDTEVVVVGGGPTGLMLATELALAGVDVTVLERLAERSGHSKAMNLQPRTAEVLDLRDLLAAAWQRSLGQWSGGHFAGLPVALNYEGWDSSHPYQIGIPQARVEEILQQRLETQGVPVRWSHELTCLEQDAAGVTAMVRTPEGTRRIHARYLVGCDGGRSTVCKQLDVGFPGTDTTSYGIVADVVLSGVPAQPRSQRDLLDEQPEGTNFAGLIPLGEAGHYRLGFSPARPVEDPRSPVDTEEIESVLTRLYGADVALTAVHWASRFGDAARQVDRYRIGRVLLAGDAAHIHIPAGGQGLNLGVQDAMNLGWKLAARVHGRVSRAVLDTYHTERHRVGARVLANTRAQGRLMVRDAEAQPLRDLFVELMGLPEVNRHLAGMVSGLDVRYDEIGPEHPLLGRRFPDCELDDPGCSSSALLHAGNGLLLTTTSHYTARAWGALVRTVEVAALPVSDADAVLIRPDGHVCWVATADDPHAAERLERTLRWWFGVPADADGRGSARQVSPGATVDAWGA